MLKLGFLGSNQKGIVTNITDYGAFVELEAGVEGLVHVSRCLGQKRMFTQERYCQLARK